MSATTSTVLRLGLGTTPQDLLLFGFGIGTPAALSLTEADIAAIANAVWAHPDALTVQKFLALK